MITILGKPLFLEHSLALVARAFYFIHNVLQCSAADAPISMPHRRQRGGGGWTCPPTYFKGGGGHIKCPPTILGLHDYSLKWALRRCAEKSIGAPPPPLISFFWICNDFPGWWRTNKKSVSPPPPPPWSGPDWCPCSRVLFFYSFETELIHHLYLILLK